jgi:Fe-S cluster biogenesis protein NfuA
VIRSSLKSGLKKVLGLGSPQAAPPPAAPAWRAQAESAPIPYPKQEAAAAPVAEAAPVAAPVEAAPVAAPVEAAPVAAPVEAAAVAPKTDVIGPALTMEALQEIMDEMVRPALQGDGGDITLIKVENNDVYVKLVGSCSTCPSSIMTMKLGVEALLKEEFPGMGQLIQVE